MPKMKTHSGAKKRFEITRTGKIRRRQAFLNHILEKKSAATVAMTTKSKADGWKVPERDALEGASDHGVSEALYLRDPDDNGVELYWDRPKEEWPVDGDGKLQMVTEALDLQGLLSEIENRQSTIDQ